MVHPDMDRRFTENDTGRAANDTLYSVFEEIPEA